MLSRTIFSFGASQEVWKLNLTLIDNPAHVFLDVFFFWHSTERLHVLIYVLIVADFVPGELGILVVTLSEKKLDKLEKLRFLRKCSLKAY